MVIPIFWNPTGPCDREDSCFVCNLFRSHISLLGLLRGYLACVLGLSQLYCTDVPLDAYLPPTVIAENIIPYKHISVPKIWPILGSNKTQVGQLRMKLAFTLCSPKRQTLYFVIELRMWMVSI